MYGLLKIHYLCEGVRNSMSLPKAETKIFIVFPKTITKKLYLASDVFYELRDRECFSTQCFLLYKLFLMYCVFFCRTLFFESKVEKRNMYFTFYLFFVSLNGFTYSEEIIKRKKLQFCLLKSDCMFFYMNFISTATRI